MKTFMPSAKTIERKWYIVDAEGQNLGRMASQIASVLRGKNKPVYTPFMDMGDYVIVINADKVAVTGKKLDDKIYATHTGQPGGHKYWTLRELMQTKPDMAVKLAVKGMLPKNTLGREMFSKLKVYVGTEHGHEAQKPEVMTIKD